MSVPNLSTNQWYYIYVGNNNNNALWGTKLYNNGNEGAVYLNVTRKALNTMRWQVYPINDTTHVIRCKEGGANAFLGAHYVPAEETEGHTRPYMVNGTIADDSVFWQFGSWGDDSWWLTNAQNTTRYRLNHKKSTWLLTMDSNISAAASSWQNWKFGSIAQIDDQAYSSVALPSVTVTSPGASPITTPTGSSSSSSTSATSSSSSSSSASSAPTSTPSTGLSTGAKAGIGAGLGVAALVALIVLGLFYRRKRNASKPSKPQELAYEPYQGQPQGDAAPALPGHQAEHYKPERYHGSAAATYEMPAPVASEADARGQERPAELMGDVDRR